MDSNYADISPSSEAEANFPANKKGAKFKRPFKIYENFRNVVYKKGANVGAATPSKKQVLFLPQDLGEEDEEEAEEECPDHQIPSTVLGDTPAEPESSSSDENSSSNGESLESYINGGNSSTDDSGIDSICETRLGGVKIGGASFILGGLGSSSSRKKNVWKREFVLNPPGGSELTPGAQREGKTFHALSEKKEEERGNSSPVRLPTPASKRAARTTKTSPLSEESGKKKNPTNFESNLNSSKKLTTPTDKTTDSVSGMDFGQQSVLSGEHDHSESDPNRATLTSEQVTPNAADIKELSKLISDTGALLSRNSNLRASLTISVKNKNGRDTKSATIVIPTPKLKRKVLKVHHESVESDLCRSPSPEVAAIGGGEDRPQDTSHDLDESEEERLSSSFVRHNPARKPQVIRRSMKLAPCTVAKLASKFDASKEGAKEKKNRENGSTFRKRELIKPEAIAKRLKSPTNGRKSGGGGGNTTGSKAKMPEKELKLCKRDISSIIKSLNRLDEEAAKDTAVLRRSLRRAAIAASRASATGNNENEENLDLNAGNSKNSAMTSQSNDAESRDTKSKGSNLTKSSRLNGDIKPDSKTSISNSRCQRDRNSERGNSTSRNDNRLEESSTHKSNILRSSQESGENKDSNHVELSETANKRKTLTDRYLDTLAALATENASQETPDSFENFMRTNLHGRRHHENDSSSLGIKLEEEEKANLIPVEKMKREASSVSGFSSSTATTSAYLSRLTRQCVSDRDADVQPKKENEDIQEAPKKDGHFLARKTDNHFTGDQRTKFTTSVFQKRQAAKGSETSHSFKPSSALLRHQVASKVQKKESLRLPYRPTKIVKRNESILSKVSTASTYYEKFGGSVGTSTYAYDDVAAPSHKYIDLLNLNNSYMDLASAVYTEIGSRRSFAYDEVKSPEDEQRELEHSYLTIMKEEPEVKTLTRSHSEDNISVLNRYECIVEEEKEGEFNEEACLVTARPALVVADDDMSIIYDEIPEKSRSSTLNSQSRYNPPLGGGLYESIAGSILNLAANKSGEDVVDLYSICDKKRRRTANNKAAYSEDEDEPDLDPHEVLTYTLAKLSEASSNFKRSGSKRDSVMSGSMTSGSGSGGADKSSDEWIDLEDETEDEDFEGNGFGFGQLDRNQSFVRTSIRVSHRGRGKWQNRSTRRPWNQAVMEVQKKMQDSNNEGDDDLYESIYEVVNPPENMDCHDFDDDFDSESDFDEILEEDEVSGNFTTRKQRTLNRHQRQSYLPNGQPKQLSKFAEAAGKKMKKLRRNWSLKKNDITRSLSRIRKNSRPIFPTAGGEAIFRDALRRKPSRNPSFSSSGAAKSVVKCNGQALLPAGLHHSGVNSDGTMFYITLNIEDINGQNQSKESSNGDSSQSTSRSGSVISSQPPVRPPPPRPGSRKASSISNLSSSSGHKSHYAVVRPTEAPPAPPPSGFHKPRIASPSPSSDYGPPSRRPPPPPPSELSSIPASLLSGSNSPYREFYVGFSTSEDGSSNASSSELGLCGLDHVEETYTSSLFQTEPLYQFYDRELSSDSASSHSSETITNGAVDNKKSGETSGESTVENMYESVISRPSDILDNEVRRTSSNNNAPDLPPKQLRKLKSRSSAMDLVHNNARNGRRSMWTELPEVIESGILNSISLNEKKLQEALFEVVSSEASYLKSLNVLISHFVQSPKLIGDTSVISKRDYRILFSDVIAVRQCSEKFLEDLEKRWQDSVMLTGITPIVKAHASDNFQVYVKYCSNQVYQDRILRKLTAENPKFVETLRELESSPACQSLAMHSFLMLPMQRITRLPLLINAIYERLNAEHDGEENPEYASCKEALDTLNKLVKECNESARSMERMEELLILSQQLDFRDVRAVPLISASRWLVKRGEPTRLWWRENSEAKLTFGRSKVNRQQLCLFLFTDLLVITRKKNEENYLVMDHCPRNLVTLVELDSTEGIPGGGKYLSEQENHLAWLTLLQNHENKTLEWLISFGSQMDRLRWMEAVTPQTSENPEEKIYEEWDCPQIEGVQNYDAQDSDELALKKGETANVLRKLSDSGWMYLERRSDGHRGWVPMRVTREIESSHVRARNFKQRHAFLKLISSDAPDSLAASLATAVGAANVAAGNVGRSFSEE